MTDTTQQIIDTTEVRRHNGQCEYGEWEPLNEQTPDIVEAISDEIVDAMCRDMRREPTAKNTDETGIVNIGGQSWVYRR